MVEDVSRTLLSFSLENNLRQDAQCLLLDSDSNQVRTTRVSSERTQPVQFSGLHSHSLYYIRCEVSLREKGRNTFTVLAESGLVPVTTRRSFFASLLLSLFALAFFTLALAGVLFLVKKLQSRGRVGL